MRPLARLGLIAALLAALLAGRASAHAQLVAAEPPANAVVAQPPAELVLEFSEPVQPLVLRWFPAAGAPPLPARPRAEGSRLVVPVPAELGEGTQILSWRVVSADGHPVAGSHVFSIGAVSGTAGPPPAATASAARAAAARGLLTLALVLGVGGAVFLRLVDRGTPAPHRARALARLAAWATLPAAALALGVHGLDLLGAAPAELAGRAPWAAALASPFAATAAASLLAALAAAAALRRDGAAPRAWALAAWGLAALSFALFGHAATAPPRWLTAPAVALHAAAFVFWIGALPGLAERAAAGPALPTLRRFSALALPLVAGLMLSGALLAVVQLGRPRALVDTAYGRLLAAKLALVALLLLLAALNRFRLTPRMAAGGAAARGIAAFRRSVAAELLLGLLILALASGFRMTPPPRTLAAAASAPQAAHAHAHGRTVMAGIMLTPGRAGANMVEIAVHATDQTPLDPLEVTLAFSDPARGVEPIRLAATRDAARWRAGPVQLPHPGEWTLTIDVLVSDFAKETLATGIEIAP